MRVFSKILRSYCDVYAIRIDQDGIVFYVTDPDTIGLSVVVSKECDIIDPYIGEDFYFLSKEEKPIAYILWKHFDSVEHLATIANFDVEPQAVEEFEIERAKKEASQPSPQGKRF